MSTDLPPSPWLRPVGPPTDPLARPGRHSHLVQELHERALAGLERARAVDASARERMAAAAAGASGESLEGAVTVRVDAKGMIQSAAFGPEITGLTPEELRGGALAALEEAKRDLGLRARPPTEALAALFDRPVAEALLRLLTLQEER